VPRDEVLAIFASAPSIDADKFREDVDVAVGRQARPRLAELMIAAIAMSQECRSTR
jgi:hypothetical protein